MTESEMFDKFVDGLKREVKIEVLKSTVGTFEQAAQVVLRVDSALWSAARIGGNRKRGIRQDSFRTFRNLSRRPLFRTSSEKRNRPQNRNKWKRKTDEAYSVPFYHLHNYWLPRNMSLNICVLER